jgi:hypothetical protein
MKAIDSVEESLAKMKEGCFSYNECLKLKNKIY